MKKPILTVVVLTLILGIAVPAFADQQSDAEDARKAFIAKGDFSPAAATALWGTTRSAFPPPTNEMHGVPLIDTSNEAGSTNIATSTLQPDGSILVTQSVTHGDGRTEGINKRVDRSEWSKLPGHGYTGGTGVVTPKTATMPDGSPVGLSIDEPKTISNTATTTAPTAQTSATEQKPVAVKVVEVAPPKTLVSYESAHGTADKT